MGLSPQSGPASGNGASDSDQDSVLRNYVWTDKSLTSFSQ